MDSRTKLDTAYRALRDAVDSLDIEHKAVADSATAVDKAVMLFDISNVHEAFDELVKRLFWMKEFFSKTVVPTALLNDDTPRISIDSIGKTVSILTKYSATIVDKPKALEWLRSPGNGDLVGETVNAGTLASFLKARMVEEGIDPDPELFKFSTYKVTSLTGYKSKT